MLEMKQKNDIAVNIIAVSMGSLMDLSVPAYNIQNVINKTWNRSP